MCSVESFLYDFFFVHSFQTFGSILLGYLIKFLKLVYVNQYFFRDNHIDVLVQDQKSCISKFLGSVKCLRMSLKPCKNKCASFTKEQVFLALESLMRIFKILCQAD